MNPNKLKKLRIHSGIIEFLLEGGEKHYRVVEGALPNDVVLINIIPDSSTFPIFWFILASESWPELKDGDLIPEIEAPIFEKLMEINK